MRPAVRRQQTVHQGLQPVGLADDDLGVLGHLGRVHLHFEQLCRPADAAQRVLDLVGQVADQLLVGLRLVDQALLAVLTRLRLQRQHFDDDFARALGLGHDHMHRQGFALLPKQHRVVAQRGKFIVVGTGQRTGQHLRLREAVRKVGTFDAAARLAHGIFQRGVGKQRDAVAAHHSHQRGQQIKGEKPGRVGGQRGQANYFAPDAGAAVATGAAPADAGAGAGERPSSRRMPAMSLSLRAMAALSSATRSRYFWWLRLSMP
ncbi:MAG: hypothetical protein BWX79_01948 [Alphaproteobacteria bacterium ADurb.Bin100]|nr:MAG: hypothetical protein BWX79_01948 [Alphaproteobacteria bacterium ADurb.Bin100]